MNCLKNVQFGQNKEIKMKKSELIKLIKEVKNEEQNNINNSESFKKLKDLIPISLISTPRQLKNNNFVFKIEPAASIRNSEFDSFSINIKDGGYFRLKPKGRTAFNPVKKFDKEQTIDSALDFAYSFFEKNIKTRTNRDARKTAKALSKFDPKIPDRLTKDGWESVIVYDKPGVYMVKVKR